MSSIIDEIKIDKNLNVKELQNEAKRNVLSAKLELAKRLILGEGVKVDLNTARTLLEDVAVSDKGEANYILGRLYVEELLEDSSNKKGIEKIENASAKGYESSTLFLAFSALNGVNGVPKDIEIADKNLRKLALSGNCDAQFELAKIYEYGIKEEISADILEAIRWYELSAKGGVSYAYNRLGYIYFYGSEDIEASTSNAINNWESELKIKANDETYSMLSKAYAKLAIEYIDKMEEKNEIDERNKKVLNEIK